MTTLTLGLLIGFSSGSGHAQSGLCKPNGSASHEVLRIELGHIESGSPESSREENSFSDLFFRDSARYLLSAVAEALPSSAAAEHLDLCPECAEEFRALIAALKDDAG